VATTSWHRAPHPHTVGRPKEIATDRVARRRTLHGIHPQRAAATRVLAGWMGCGSSSSSSTLRYVTPGSPSDRVTPQSASPVAAPYFGRTLAATSPSSSSSSFRSALAGYPDANHRREDADDRVASIFLAGARAHSDLVLVLVSLASGTPHTFDKDRTRRHRRTLCVWAACGSADAWSTGLEEIGEMMRSHEGCVLGKWILAHDPGSTATAAFSVIAPDEWRTLNMLYAAC
jgi:hypothetical protein